MLSADKGQKQSRNPGTPLGETFCYAFISVDIQLVWGFSWVRIMVKAMLTRHNHRDTWKPPSPVPGLVAATVAHTAPWAWPCRSRLRWPCAHPLPCPWAQTLCPISPLSSTGHMAASSSSSQDLWRIIHSLRGSQGWPPRTEPLLLTSLPDTIH